MSTNSFGSPWPVLQRTGSKPSALVCKTVSNGHAASHGTWHLTIRVASHNHIGISPCTPSAEKMPASHTFARISCWTALDYYRTNLASYMRNKSKHADTWIKISANSAFLAWPDCPCLRRAFIPTAPSPSPSNLVTRPFKFTTPNHNILWEV
jgi:hypothetical protein